MFRSLLCGMLPPDRKSPISSFPPTSIRHPRNAPTSSPCVPHVIPAKAGIWMCGTAASLALRACVFSRRPSLCACLRRPPRRAGAEEGGACGDEQAAGKEEE